MHDLTLTGYLDQLADRQPAPGGGAVAALHAAQAYALTGMVARYTTGPRYAQHAAVVDPVVTDTDQGRAVCLTLAEEDAAAFVAVTEAYKLPKASSEEQTARTAAIGAALTEAARVPAQVIGQASEALALAEELAGVANPNVITDIGAAADAARAAATTARLNIEVNLSGILDEAVRETLREAVGQVEEITARADALAAVVRKQVAG